MRCLVIMSRRCLLCSVQFLLLMVMIIEQGRLGTDPIQLMVIDVLIKTGGILVDSVEDADVDLSLDEVTRDMFVNLFA